MAGGTKLTTDSFSAESGIMCRYGRFPRGVHCLVLGTLQEHYASFWRILGICYY